MLIIFANLLKTSSKSNGADSNSNLPDSILEKSKLFFDYSKKIDRLNLSKLTNNQLIKISDEWFFKYRRFSSIFNLTEGDDNTLYFLLSIFNEYTWFTS